MAERIVSRELIAQQASSAAAWAAAHPKEALPPNPYDEHLEPEHHREWAASFKRQLHWHRAPEGEGSA